MNAAFSKARAGYRHWHTLVLALLAVLAASPVAAFMEREVAFTEADIQAALDRARPQQIAYGHLLTVRIDSPPRVTLDGDDGRAGLSAGLDVDVQGQAPFRVDIAGRSSVRYDDQKKAFFLDRPVIESVGSPTLAKEATPLLRQAVSQLMQGYFRTQPVYVLRADGSPQEATARWLLKSVRIERGRIVAVLSPL